MYWEEIVWLYEAPTHRHQKAEYPAAKTIAYKNYTMIQQMLILHCLLVHRI